MAETSKLEKNLIIFATFIILYASTSYFCKNSFSETINVAIMIVGLMPLLLLKRKIQFENRTIMFYLVLSGLSIVSSLLAGDSAKYIIYPCLTMMIALLYSSVVSLSQFKNAFLKIMVFISVYAIAVYIIYSLFPEFITSFPTITNTSGNSAYNLLFVIVTPRTFYRSEGFFWEPGAFQTFINFAIPIAAFSDYQQKRKYLIVLYIALIITFSTTAWIVGLLNLVIIIIKTNSYKKNNWIKAITLLILLAMALLLFLNYAPSVIGGSTFGIEKIRSFFEGTSKNGYDSASVRYDSMYYPFIAFLNHPLFGVGYSGIDEITSVMLHSMVTCTPVNYLAMYGIFYGGIILALIYSYCSTFDSRNIIKILLTVSFLLATFSEQYVNYAIIDVFIIMGARTNKWGEVYDENSRNK